MTDGAAIHAVITDPWIAARVRHDYREPGFIEHPDIEYLGCYVGEELVGVFMLIHDFIEVTIHAYIKREWTRYGRVWGAGVIAHAFGRPEVLRLTAPILEPLKSAVNYCRKLGFEVEGFQRDAIMKDGQPVGAYLLGMTRRQYERN